jgi:hypothetical protein
MKRLKKAFERHEPELFKEWKEKLVKGEVTVKGAQLLPHELIHEVKQKCGPDVVCEAQWKVLEQQIANMGSLGDSIIVCDVSGSMGTWGFSSQRQKPAFAFTPMDVAIGLSLLVAHAAEGSFRNHIITFHEDPTFHVVPDSSLFNRFKSLAGAKWGNSTNLQAVFDLILTRAQDHKLTDLDMPKRIFIISDMQFNIATNPGFRGGSSTNFEAIEAKYATAGYQRPQIVFWNVVGSTNDFPVTVNQEGTAMISGFSTAVMSAIVKGASFSPYSIMRETIDGPRYSSVYKALSGPDLILDTEERPVALFIRGCKRYEMAEENVAECARQIVDRYAGQHPRLVVWNGDLLLSAEDGVVSYTSCLLLLREAFPRTTFVAFKPEDRVPSLGWGAGHFHGETDFGGETGYPEEIFGKLKSYHESLQSGSFYVFPVSKDGTHITEGPTIIRHWLDRNFRVSCVTVGESSAATKDAMEFENEISSWHLKVQRENKTDNDDSS